MGEKTQEEKRREICVNTDQYFQTVQQFLRLTANSVSLLKLVEAMKYLEICESTIKTFAKRLKQVINEI